MQDDEGRDAMDHTPFDAEYVKGMIRNKSGKSMTSIRFMRNHSYFGHRFIHKKKKKSKLYSLDILSSEGVLLPHPLAAS